MADALPLFPDAPEARDDGVLCTDGFLLEPCRRCHGTGREACPYPSYYRIAQEWDATCRGCNGGGRVLRKLWGR